MTASATAPEGVSPGAVDRSTGVEVRCPTFSWQAVPSAVGYEVVVYELATRSDFATWNLDDAVEVLVVALPSGVTAWTPSFENGLTRGPDHVWFVRGVLGDIELDDVNYTEWSTARFFRVAGTATQTESVLQYRERVGDSGTESGSRGTNPQGVEAGPVRNTMAKRLGEVMAKDVGTAMAAIRGAMPGVSGETYGVVGTSNSPDGAGIGAANTAGGPDLVLDGSVDLLINAEFSESGIDRPSGSPQSFTFSNSSGGGMTLDVDGIEVTTTESELDAGKLAAGTVPDERLAGPYSQALTLGNPGNQFAGSGAGLVDVNADTLNGIAGSDYTTDLEAVGLIALHAVSADHDERYYTKTELNTRGGGGAVHWDNLTWVPAGFADGVDDNTVHTAGLGVIVENGILRVDPAAFSTRFSMLDSGGVGGYSSIAIGADGLGLISYWDDDSVGYEYLKVAHCNDTICSSATTTILDGGVNNTAGEYSSIAIGTDGLGLISYFNAFNHDLKVAHCTDTACSSATTTTLDSTGIVGAHTSIAIGTDGLGLISYFDSTNGNLKVAHCADIACSTATTATLDSTGSVGEYTSIAIGTDGLGLISYFDDTNDDLKVAHCNNTACSSATTYTLDSFGSVGYYTSIAIGADGLGLISYHDGEGGSLNVAHCSNTVCSTAYNHRLDDLAVAPTNNSIAIGADGLGLIGYYGSNGDLKIARCIDTICRSATTATLAVGPWAGYYLSITIGADSLGLLSYYRPGNHDLCVVHLGIGVP